MNKVLATLFLVVILTSCSNAPNMETGEIKSLQILKEAFDKSTNSTRFVDARNLLSREQVDAAKTPVLFVELASGQNGTLTPYPGQGFGQTWLGADGATITLERGILKASRGMGDDLMGSSLSTLVWSKIYNKTENYNRELSYLSGNNKISNRIFICNINRISGEQAIEIWDITFKVVKFEETCTGEDLMFKNTYYVDTQGIVRRSTQYHSNTLGSILIERLDR